MELPFGPPPPPPPPRDAPLPERMRPRRLDEVVGQEHLLGENGFLRRALAAGTLPSLILWGPPGTGKTTIARLLAAELGARFEPLSAVSSGVREVREAVARAGQVRRAGGRVLLFIDEIHRFHRGQQDALLPHVERGTVTLVGATTENPAHTVVAPLVSRCRVLVLEPLSPADLEEILRRALADPERGLGGGVEVPEEIVRSIAREADGDARRALVTLELAAALARERARGELPARVTAGDVATAAQRRLLRADRQGDAHYDLASAFIKAMRGSDGPASVYWMMRMIESGVDPRFVARRMIILAAEDIGPADPRALAVAVAAAEALDRVGLPEATLPLAEAALYLARAPKSNEVIRLRDWALSAIRERGNLPVPPALRDAHAALSRELGHGRGYRYPHDQPPGAPPMDYLPPGLPRPPTGPGNEGEPGPAGPR